MVTRVGRESLRDVVVVVAVVLCLVIGPGGGLLLWRMRSTLPAEVVTHWGFDGRPDATTPLRDALVTDAVVCTVVPLFVMAIGLMRKQGRGAMTAFGAAFGVWMGATLYGSVWLQREGSAGADHAVGTAMLWALALALIVGAVLGGMVRLGRTPAPVASPDTMAPDAPRLLIDPAVRVSWTGRSRPPGAVSLILVVPGVGLLVLTIVNALNGDAGMAVVLAFLAIVVAVLGLSMHAEVTIDRRGVRVRALRWITWVNIGLPQIEAASVTAIDPLGDFGGWGRRAGFDGSEGFVTAKGDGLRIDRAGALPFYLTVDTPETAAATLNTLVERRSHVDDDRF